MKTKAYKFKCDICGQTEFIEVDYFYHFVNHPFGWKIIGKNLLCEDCFHLLQSQCRKVNK